MGIDHEELERFTTELIHEYGTDRSSAEEVAESLIRADLRGHHSHGVRLFPAKYAPEIEDGEIRPSEKPVVEREKPNAAVIDGRRSFGHVAGRRAIETAIEKSADTGISVVSVRNITHLGRIGEWTERAVANGLLFVAFVCNPESQYVAPPGSTERRFSTNPVAVGVPTFEALEFPIVLDMASSQVANGKVMLYGAADRDLPEGWVVSPEGDSITGPERFLEGDGALLPLGGFTSGYKGFGIWVVAESVAAILSDGYVSNESDAPWGNQAAFVTIDPTMFTSRERIEEQVTTMAEYVHETGSIEYSLTGAASGDRPLLPGEAEYEHSRRQRAEGVELPPRDAFDLTKVTEERNLDDRILNELSAIAAGHDP